MALIDENGSMGTTMLVQPSGMGGNGGFGDWSGSGFWILILFILLGGWNNNGFGGGFGGNDLYPWMSNSQNISGGFRDQMLNTQIMGLQNSVTTGIGDIQNSLCAGFAGVNANINNGFAQAENGANARQMANMQQLFGVQSALQNCCCENRAGLADVKYTIATENCADRTAAAQNTRDIIDSQTRGTQAILDKLCALELDGVKGQLAQAQRENVGLQNQLNMAALRESQTAQNAFIQQGFSNEIDALYNRLNSCPVPTTPVYGRTPIFTCANNTVGCGCGM